MRKLSEISPKAKKVTIVTCATIVCVCALSIIIYNVSNVSPMSEPAAASGTGTAAASLSASAEIPAGSVTPAPITSMATSSMPSGIAGTGSAWTPSSGSKVSAPLTVSSNKPTAPPKPVIQGESKDGKQPTNNALIDESKKPAYTTQPKAPAASKAPASSSPSKKSDSGSDMKRSENDPFNNVTVEAGGNQGTLISGDHDSHDNDQVGTMD